MFERSPTAELNNCEIARLTGIPRTTVRDWVRLPRDRWQRTVGSACPECGQPAYAFEELPAGDCAYLLGIYLGDGTISRGRRGVWKLRIKMDIRYPSIIEECAAAVRAVMPRNRVSIYEHVGGSNAVEICSHSKSWPCLFPQHGAGRKHERRIALVPWQEAIVELEPGKLLRGLIHSDGCRILNRVNGTDYPRYFFSQVSMDIQELFRRTCGKLGIECANNRWNSISVARRHSVAKLDAIVGSKS